MPNFTWDISHHILSIIGLPGKALLTVIRRPMGIQSVAISGTAFLGAYFFNVYFVSTKLMGIKEGQL